MKVRNRGPSRRDDHQIHREALGASGSRGNSHEGRQVLAGNDFRGWPNSDDPARRRSGRMPFFFDQRGVQVFDIVMNRQQDLERPNFLVPIAVVTVRSAISRLPAPWYLIFYVHSKCIGARH